MADKKGFKGQAFTSMLSLISFLVLVLTGLLMFLEPHGRVAYWTIWSFLGLTKDQWGAIHVLGGLLFLITGIFHIYFNWRLLFNYLTGKVQSGLKYQKELVLSCLVLLLVVSSGIWSLPPLVYVLDWGEDYKNSWVTSPDLEPPFGHAENVTLRTFTRKQGIDFPKAKDALEKAGYKLGDPKNTLEEIALANKTTPVHLYAAIKDLEPKFEAPREGQKWTVQLVEEKFSGSGLGRLTLKGLCEKTGLDLNKAQAKLKEMKIEMGPEDKFKATADKNKTKPLDLLKKLLID
jgi:hypothetical protein